MTLWSANRSGVDAAAAPPVLMLFLEPAPYIVGLVEAVRKVWPARVDVLYAAKRISQDWGYQAREGEFVLPPSQAGAMAEIKRRLSSGQYGLMHLAGWGHPLLWKSMLYAARRRVPVTVQTDTPAPAGEAAWKRIAKILLYPPMFRLPAMFTPAGTPQAAYLRSFGVPQSRIRVAQLTVDVTAIQDFSAGFTAERRSKARREFGLADDDVAILYIGRLEPHKGIEALLAAFASLEGKMRNLTLLIAGGGTLRDRVIAAASDKPAITYLGRLAGEAVWEVYNIADIFVLPSRFEPWGLVVNEAMAAGLPVVVTNRVGCATDLVREGVTGLVVPPASSTALGQALETLCGNAELRKRMGEESRRLISGWTLINQARNTTAAWQQVLQAA